MPAARETEQRTREKERGAAAPIALAFATLCALVLVAYWPALEGGMLWDDDQYLTKAALRSWTGLARIWTELGATPQYYPVTYSAFWVQHKLWGETLIAYHAINLVLQALNAFLVWRILNRLEVRGALLAAAIFAVHPVQVESVAWITELKNTLSGALYLSALWFYLRFDPLEHGAEEGRRPPRHYLCALVAFTLAVLAKSVTASLPAALLLVAWWRLGCVSWKRHVLPLVPFFLIAIGLGALTVWMEAHVVGASGEPYALSVLERAMLAGRVVCFYLAKLVWPTSLTFIYPRWEVDAKDAGQYVYPALALVMLAAAWVARTRFGRGPLAASLYFVGTLFPVLGFVNVFPFKYSYVADHFQYLACLGPIALFSAWVGGGAATSGAPRSATTSAAGNAVSVVLVLLLCLLAHRQSRAYRDVAGLWRTTIERNPRCWMAHTNLGVLKGDAGDWSGALECFQRALDIDPRLVDARYDLGHALDRLGRHDEAIVEYERTLAIDPRAYRARGNLGRILMSRGLIEAAVEHFEEALAIEPRFVEGHDNLGLALAYRGRLAEAIEHHRRAVELNPDFAAGHEHLGTALARNGDLGEAIAEFERALAIQPDLQSARANLEQTRAELARRESREQ